MKAEDIRFVTRGLGPLAAAMFGQICDQEPSGSAIDDVTGLADGIAGMATALRRHGLSTGTGTAGPTGPQRGT